MGGEKSGSEFHQAEEDLNPSLLLPVYFNHPATTYRVGDTATTSLLRSHPLKREYF